MVVERLFVESGGLFGPVLLAFGLSRSARERGRGRVEERGERSAGGTVGSGEVMIGTCWLRLLSEREGESW